MPVVARSDFQVLLTLKAKRMRNVIISRVHKSVQALRVRTLLFVASFMYKNIQDIKRTMIEHATQMVTHRLSDTHIVVGPIPVTHAFLHSWNHAMVAFKDCGRGWVELLKRSLDEKMLMIGRTFAIN